MLFSAFRKRPQLESGFGIEFSCPFVSSQARIMGSCSLTQLEKTGPSWISALNCRSWAWISPTDATWSFTYRTRLFLCAITIFGVKFIRFHSSKFCLSSAIDVDFRKPDTLRSMAWLTLVRKMKKTNHNHPYKEALKWLPFNSDLRFPVWTSLYDCIRTMVNYFSVLISNFWTHSRE